VTKLGDGPNSLVSSDDGFPTTRLKCFPLYSVLLAYNVTTLDYLSLDSPEAPDGQVNKFNNLATLEIHDFPNAFSTSEFLYLFVYLERYKYTCNFTFLFSLFEKNVVCTMYHFEI